MPLAAGTRIGGYEIVALLGAGGMGEVYRAQDQRLGRDVAIKIVSPAIAGDADGLMRFEREARLLAALNHPNIAAIYGVEDHGDQPVLILELVEGETLADRIARGPIPVDEALSYARQIADALDSAHEAGIVHRDLKPGNIKITESGAVKVLDFGLAKAIAVASAPEAVIDPAQSPTVTVKGTRGGVILGTAAYMSPEQARGRAIDKRTDIWAFGCVLYEMLTGRRVFDGETTSDVIAAILERQPDLARLPSSIPHAVRAAIARCLEKDPKRRSRDIADVRVQLDSAFESPVGRDSSSRRPVMIGAAVVSLALAGVYAGAMWPSRPAAPALHATEFAFGPAAGAFLGSPPAPSPDGRHIAYVARDGGRTSIWVRSIDAIAPRELDGTEGAFGDIFWSPDGTSLGFLANGALKRAPVDGGPVITLTAGVSNIGASWGDNVIILSPINRAPLVRLPATGGTPAPLTRLDPQTENSHRWPHFLPDGRHFLFTVRSDSPANQGIRLGSLDSPEVTPLINVASPGVYVEPGFILYVTPDSVLMAQPFDAATLTLSGTPRPVAANVRYNGPSASAAFSASRDGSVVAYFPMPRTGAKLVWHDRTGRNLGTVGPERRYYELRLSPDGRRVAVVIPDEHLATRDIWMLDVATQVLTRVTSNPATDWRPVWSPDSSTLLFASDRAGLSSVFRMPASATGGETLAYRWEQGGAFPREWSRDGARVFLNRESDSGQTLTVSSMRPDGSDVRDIATGVPRPGVPRLSPDGKLLSFQSAATGALEIYVMSLADGQRTRVSTAGGVAAMWGRGARELLYVNTEGVLMQSGITTGATVTATTPVPLFRPCETQPGAAPYAAGPTEETIDMTADGERLLAICEGADAVPTSTTVILNWQSRLR